MTTSAKDLLQFCRYYKGEKVNPFEVSDKSYLWQIEEEWYKDTSDFSSGMGDTMRYSLNRFISSGFDDVGKFDKTPLTLKAMLFTLFEHWNEGYVTRESFATFYRDWFYTNI